MSKMWGGRGEEADQALEQAIRVVGDAGWAFEFTTVVQLRVANSILRGRIEDALAQAEEALAVSLRLERRHSSGMQESLVAMALNANGRIEAALATLRALLASEGASERP